MTEPVEDLAIENKIIVTFDICSSSDIMEDLTLTGNLRAMRNLLINIKRFLMNNATTVGFEIYKFTGDGWILLFPEDAKGKFILDFLKELSIEFKRLIGRVVGLLETKPNILGITFGIEKGPLIRIKMVGRKEYIGRAINIACRLQNAIKDNDQHPEYKVLISSHAFKELLKGLDTYSPVRVKRKLRNIRGGNEYRCIKLNLFA